MNIINHQKARGAHAKQSKKHLQHHAAHLYALCNDLVMSLRTCQLVKAFQPLTSAAISFPLSI